MGSRRTFDWTPERDAVLREMVKERKPPREIAAHFGCTHHQVYWRCTRLRIDRSDIRCKLGRPEAVPDLKPEWSPEQLSEMHRAFAAAMIDAVKRGEERAPFGVVKAPATANPIFVMTPSWTPTQSVAADVAAIGSRAGHF